MTLHINIDGASRGNPGPASIGVFIRDEQGRVVKEHGHCLGETTNNVAEYTALKHALGLAKQLGGTHLKIQSDSLLLVQQFNGRYKVKNQRLFEFLCEIQKLRREFVSVELSHVRRELNVDADSLANAALDGTLGAA
ncbi:MAG: ribonuclease HI family protein [Elusimicrobia bacterium]|nr:ribonuclease HI family protein [Elusimicrobiota bacterium]